jgi:hypothetical protein
VIERRAVGAALEAVEGEGLEEVEGEVGLLRGDVAELGEERRELGAEVPSSPRGG